MPRAQKVFGSNFHTTHMKSTPLPFILQHPAVMLRQLGIETYAEYILILSTDMERTDTPRSS